MFAMTHVGLASQFLSQFLQEARECRELALSVYIHYLNEIMQYIFIEGILPLCALILHL